MKNFMLCLFFLLESTFCGAQTYYYYKGEKINVVIDSSKCTVFRFNDTMKMKQKFDDSNQRNNWSIEDRFLVSSEMKRSNSSSDLLSIEPVIATTQTPVSRFFYVKLKTDNDTLFLKEFAKQHGCMVERQVAEMPQWYVLSTSLSSTGNSIELSNRCFETGRVVDVDPGFMFDMKPSCINETAWITGDLWNLQAINCCDAWEFTKGKDSIIVAVLDTGIEPGHIEFPRLLDGYDAITGESAVVYHNIDSFHTKSVKYHGTMVAGFIAAAQNGQFISGVAPNVTLLPISHNFKLSETMSEELANGISWAWKSGAHIINNSWGDTDATLHSALLEDAIHDALTKGRDGLGTIVTFASGNDYSINYPAYVNDSIICVGSINESFQWVDGSGYGEKLDVVAPGEDLLGTVPFYEGNVYPGSSGTSFACPHVSGIAALMLSVNPFLDVCQLAAIIDSTSNKLEGFDYIDVFPYGSWNLKTGYGLVDAGKAVNAAKDLLPSLKLYQIMRPSYSPSVPSALVYIDVMGSGVPYGYNLDWKILSPELSYISNYKVTKLEDNFYEIFVEGIPNKTFIDAFVVQVDMVKQDERKTSKYIIDDFQNSQPVYTMQLHIPKITMGFRYLLNENIVSNKLIIKKISNYNEKVVDPSCAVVNVYSLQNKMMTVNVEGSMQGNNIVIDVDKLPKGNYIVNIIENGEVVFVDKFYINR